MGVQFERVTYSPRHSLTLIVDDIARHRREATQRAGAPVDLDAWVNALHRQSQPLIASKEGKDNLLAWLDAVEEAMPAAE